MIVVSLRLSLRLHGIQSLKDKRKPRQSLVDRLRSELRVAVAEVADQDNHDQLTLGIAAVGSDRAVLERVMEDVVAFVDRQGIGEMVSEDRRWDRW